MTNLKNIMILLIMLLYIGCSKDEVTKKDSSQVHLRNSRSSTIDRALIKDTSCAVEQIMSKEDNEILKYTLGKFIARNMENTNFKEVILNRIQSSTYNEILVSELMGENIDINGTSTTFEDLLIVYYGENYPQHLDLLQSICNVNWNISISMPWWAVQIIDQTDIQVLTHQFSIVPATEPVVCNSENVRVGFSGNEEFLVLTDKFHLGKLPLYIKATESLLEYSLEDGSEFKFIFDQWTTQFGECDVSTSDITSFLKTIDCADITAIDVIAFREFVKVVCSPTVVEEICDNGIDDDGDGYIDEDDMDCIPEICDNGIDDDGDGLIDEEDDECIDNMPGEICDNFLDDDGDGLIDYQDPDCVCEKSCQRDCHVESNVLKGLKFGSGGYGWVCQLHDEENILLEYTFSAVKLCDENTTSGCKNINIYSGNEDEDFYYRVGGQTPLFFEMQKGYEVHEDDVDVHNIYVGEDNIVWVSEAVDGWHSYWKAFPIYHHVNLFYMSGKFQNNWNGDILGDHINVDVFELDNNMLTSSNTESTSTSVSTTYSAGVTASIGIPKLIQLGLNSRYTYSNTERNTQTQTLVRRFDKDIKVTEFALLYCDEDKVYPDPTGVSGVTWYGHIPGVTTNDPDLPTGAQLLYQEFRVDDN